jgi:Methylamine utilisation protein MauE
LTRLTLLDGVWISLACLLIGAACLKARDENSFVVRVGQLLPKHAWRGPITPRRAARTIWLVELATGVAMVTVLPQPPAAAAAWVCTLFLLFVGLVVRASRRDVPCGCFGADERSASRADIWRATWLVAGAATSLVISSSNTGTTRPSDIGSIVVVAAVFLFLAFTPSLISRSRRRRADGTAGLQTRTAATDSRQTRRAFLARVAAAALAAIFYAVVPQSASAGTEPSCAACYGDCAICCGSSMMCNSCCGACYYACRFFSGGPCLSNCNSCWTC